MKAKDIMNKEVVSATDTSTIKDVALILLKREFSGLPIVNKDNKLVGIVSDKDIFKLLNPGYKEYYAFGEAEEEDLTSHVAHVGETQVSEVMTKDVISVKPEDSLVKVGAVMMLKKIHRVLVLDDNKLVGIISREDIYPRTLEIFK